MQILTIIKTLESVLFVAKARFIGGIILEIFSFYPKPPTQ
ncbi:Hypothetical protein BN2458_PEG0140 [Helicobacter typhlonius]|uniref:Uncharacterized protein n=1 Tax=Helicobacter typhlonius TaxID=76936 RepID=A0A0S4PRS0_9HELI|nr:Hypothetical protein BN2458_PEG0140 [Helicobacter typhlonius]